MRLALNLLSVPSAEESWIRGGVIRSVENTNFKNSKSQYTQEHEESQN